MSARTHVVDSGGTARLVRRMFVIDSGGTARAVRRAFVIDSGGTARQFYSGQITAQIISTLGYVRTGANLDLQWRNTGAFQSNNNSGGGTSAYTWLTSGAVADAQIYFHQTSGNAMTGVTFDTWLDLSTTRTVTQAWPGGISSTTFTLEVSIRDKNTTVVVAGPSTLSGGTTP